MLYSDLWTVILSFVPRKYYRQLRLVSKQFTDVIHLIIENSQLAPFVHGVAEMTNKGIIDVFSAITLDENCQDQTFTIAKISLSIGGNGARILASSEDKVPFNVTYCLSYQLVPREYFTWVFIDKHNKRAYCFMRYSETYAIIKFVKHHIDDVDKLLRLDKGYYNVARVSYLVHNPDPKNIGHIFDVTLLSDHKNAIICYHEVGNATEKYTLANNVSFQEMVA